MARLVVADVEGFAVPEDVGLEREVQVLARSRPVALGLGQAAVLPEDTAEDVVVELVERRSPQPQGIDGIVDHPGPPRVDAALEAGGVVEQVAGDRPSLVRARVPLGVALAPLRPVDGVAELHDREVPGEGEGGGTLLPRRQRERHAHRPSEPESARVDRLVGELSGAEGGEQVDPVTVAGPVLGGGDERTAGPARRNDPLGALRLGDVLGCLGLEPHPDRARGPHQRRREALACVLVAGGGEAVRRVGVAEHACHADRGVGGVGHGQLEQPSRQ